MKPFDVMQGVLVTTLGVLMFFALLGVFGIETAIIALVLAWAIALLSIYRFGGRHAS